MNHPPLDSVENLTLDLQKALIAPLSHELELHQQFIRDTDELFHSYVKKIKRIEGINGISKYINETDWLKEALYQQLNEEFPPIKELKIETYFSKFYSKIDSYLLTVPEQITVEQSKERFTVQPSDELFISLLKPFKFLFFQISRVPAYIQNLFRKNKKPITYWKRNIPLKQMGVHFFRNELIEMFLIKLQELELLKCQARSVRWEINKKINNELAALLDKEENSFEELIAHLDYLSNENRLQTIINEFETKKKEWENFARELIDLQLKYFRETEEIVGTIELNRKKFTNSVSTLNHQQNSNRFQNIKNGWRNTEYAQIDDFQIDLELYQLKYTALIQFYLLQSSCKSRVLTSVTEDLHEIRNDISSLSSKIDEYSTPSELKNFLVTESIRINHQLENISIPKAVAKLYEHNFPQLIERMEFKIREQWSEMKDRRIIYSKEVYDSPISKSNLSHFNPRELVEIDIINRLAKNLLTIKANLNDALQVAETDLRDLIEIVNYNLEAAVNSTTDESLEFSEVKQIAKEGLERANAKTETIESELYGINEIINVYLRKEINQMNTNLIKLTHNENITNLRIQLAKAKAVETTKAYRREIIEKISNFRPIISRYAKDKLAEGKLLFKKFQEKVGLLEKDSTLTHELSDFLIQTDAAIQKLPFVYRRLYEIRPLDEESFFEGRQEELTQLEKSYTIWNNHKVSSAVVVGEIGSGASSLINAFIRKNPSGAIVRKQLTRNIHTEQEFLTFFDSLFPSTELLSFSEIVDFLNNGNRRTIILEDIQHFFLKKSQGFQAINLLFELISQTAKNIFWLVGTTTFAWSYLQKTIAIERYIKHKIVLKPLTSAQIINLILKRHRVSGYKLEFRSIELSKLEKRKLIGASKAQIQETYRKVFFEELNHFAQSNISLALLYWLRSTDSFEQNTVIIGKIKNIQFDFLSSLDKNSIFTLHALVIHESLTVKEHAEIFHQEEKQSRMTLMVLEDGGILKLNEKMYTINHLLYRQVVTILKNKNLIH